MTVLAILCLVLAAAAVTEKALHDRRLARIPIRIHVNGSRGKSTTTRLIAAGLRAAGLRVVAKTTGTEPRLILENGTEQPIHRRGLPNIKEQIRVTAFAARRRADALVLECMALHPESQWVSEHRMVRATIGVITNVRADHLDVMGPAERDAAAALSLTIPARGHLVTAESRFLDMLRERADALATVMHAVDAASVPDQVNESFPYLSFKENVACALEVCALLGVGRWKALRGMLAARPDPGVASVFITERGSGRFAILNACAANDRDSTLAVWRRFRSQGAVLDGLPAIAVMNNRADRPRRIGELAELLAGAIKPEYVFLVGQAAPLARRQLIRRGIERARIRSLPACRRFDDLLAAAAALSPAGATLFLLGNAKGPAGGMIRELSGAERGLTI